MQIPLLAMNAQDDPLVDPRTLGMSELRTHADISAGVPEARKPRGMLSD